MITDLPLLSSRLSSLVNNSLNSDVIFKVGPEKQPIYGHRVLFGVYPSFQALLFGGMKETSQNAIEIPNIEPETFILLQQYIYTGKIEVNPESVMPLVIAADQYCIDDLKTYCFRFLKDSLTSSNVCSILQFFKDLIIGDGKRDNDNKNNLVECGIQDMIDSCYNHIKQNTKKVLETHELTTLEEDTLIEIMSEYFDHSDELNIFQAILNWGRVNSSESRPLPIVLSNVIQHIRFGLIAPRDLKNHVKPHVGSVVPYELYVDGLESHLTLKFPFQSEENGQEFIVQRSCISTVVMKTSSTTGTWLKGQHQFTKGRKEWEVTIDKSQNSLITMGVYAEGINTVVGFRVDGRQFSGKRTAGAGFAVYQNEKVRIILDLDMGTITFKKNQSLEFSLQVGNDTYSSISYRACFLLYQNDCITVRYSDELLPAFIPDTPDSVLGPSHIGNEETNS